MEQFKYKARKRDGAVVYGTVNAPNEAAVAAFIRKQDMYVAGIEASKKKGLFSGVLFEESINLYDISIFARQFATLLGAGVPLLTGLEILTQQSAKERLRTVLGQITTSVRGIIGLLVPSHTRMNMHIFEDGHLTRLISGVEAGIENSDFRLLLIFNDKRFMDDREYMSLIQSQNIDGLLVWGAQPSETFWQEPVEAGLPIVFAVTVPGPLEQYNYTINATRAGTRKALELLASHGHRRILQLHETRNAFLERQMDAEIAEFLRERPGITIDVQDIRSSGDEIAVPLFRRPGAPTAVLAYNYSMGVEAYGRLAEAGIRVPDEIEIVSCYSYQSRKSWVSTVVVDDYEIGRTAVKNLQKLIESPDRRLQAEIPFSFFFGQTTRNAADVPTP